MDSFYPKVHELTFIMAILTGMMVSKFPKAYFNLLKKDMMILGQ